MIHGHAFHFIDLPELQHDAAITENSIVVKVMQREKIPAVFSLYRPWVPLSGQQGRYFAKSPFEEADENFAWGLELKDVLTLIWEPEEQIIYYIKGEHYSAQRLEFWIYHTFFPMSLELNRVYHFLHVGAVRVQNRTLFFSAPSFGGKSTLTDYFIQQGATLISDDAVGIEKKEDTYVAVPAYPFHRPYREPEELGYPVEKFAEKIQNIDAIFVLQKEDKRADVVIKEVKGVEKFKALYHAVFIEFPFRKKERFTFFSQMAQAVTVYRISIPWDLKRLEEVHKAIVDLAPPNVKGKLKL